MAVALLDSEGAGIAGGVQNFYGSTGSWIGNRTTGPIGRPPLRAAAGAYRFQATYSGGSQQLALTVDASQTTLTFRTFDVAVSMLDSEAAGVAGAVRTSTARPAAGWATARSAKTGVVDYELLAGDTRFRRRTGGSQQLPLVVEAVAAAPRLVTKADRLKAREARKKDAAARAELRAERRRARKAEKAKVAEAKLAEAAAAKAEADKAADPYSLTFRHARRPRVGADSQATGVAGRGRQLLRLDRQLGRQPHDRRSGELRYELLPGTYRFQATLNGGSQQQLRWSVDATHTDLAFTTRWTPPSRCSTQPERASPAPSSTTTDRRGSWVGNRDDGRRRASCTTSCWSAPTASRRRYNGGSQQLNLTVAPAAHELTFPTLDVTVAVCSSQGAGIAGATRELLRVDRQLGRQPTTGGTGGLHYALLDGSYTFQATTKGGSQQQPSPSRPRSTALIFKTAPVTALVVDAAGAPVAGASINHYGSTGSWVGSRLTDGGGQVVTELLPGTYTFRSTRWGTMSRSLTVPPSTLVTFEPGGPNDAVRAAVAHRRRCAGRSPRRRPCTGRRPGAVTLPRLPRRDARPGRRRTPPSPTRTAPDGTLVYTVVAVDAGGVASAPGRPP